jgi:tetratricopeptide (TPR) repeat protein
MREVAGGLEEAGYPTCFLQEDIPPDTSLLSRVRLVMGPCDALILIITPAVLSSEQVTKEVAEAFRRKLPIIPVLVGVTPQEVKDRRPEWKHALGSAVCCEQPDPSSCFSELVERLRAQGIAPGGGETSAAAPLPAHSGRKGESVPMAARGRLELEDAGNVEATEKEPAAKANHGLSSGRAGSGMQASMARELTRFVGREKELERISQCLGRAVGGEGCVVDVVGEAGVGKSRLVYEFVQTLPEREYLVLRSWCRYYGVAVPYLPIVEILRAFFDIDEAEDHDLSRWKIKEKMAAFDGRLDDMLPPLYEVLSLKVEDEEYQKLEPRKRRERIFEAVKRLLVSQSRIKPMVLVLEDLQWIDRTSEEFFSHFIDGIAASRVLLITLHRPEYAPEWADKPCYRRMRVDQLPLRKSADLVASILTEGKVGEELRDFIIGRASGNPLFIEELTHGLLENGSIVKSEDRFVLSPDTSDIEVPDTIQDIIAARLDHLEGNLKGLIQVASVIGREFAFNLLEAITSVQEELKTSLDNLQGLELIYEKSLFPELEYVFKHALTQEVAYASLLLKKRKEIHERIGLAIESIYADRLEEHYEVLAYHFSRSDNMEKALQYLKLSGQKAVSNYSNWEAFRFYKQAIRLMDNLPETAERKREKLELCLSTWRPAVMMNYPKGSIAILGEAERLAEELGDEKSLISVYRRFALYYSLKGDNLLGVEYSERCLDLAEEIGSADTMARIANMICNVYFVLGHVSKVADNSRRGLQIIERQAKQGDLYAAGFNLYSELSGWYGLSLTYLGELEEARMVLDKGLRNALEIDDRYGLGWMEYMRFALSYWLGDGEYAVAHARRGINYFAETDIGFLVGVVWSILGVGYFFLGEHEAANEHARKGVEVQTEEGIPVMLPVVYSNLALVQSASGDMKGALESAERSLGLSKKYHTRLYEVSARMMLGRILGEAEPEDLGDAERHIGHALSMAEEMRLKPSMAQGHLFLGELLASAGRVDEAWENLQEAETIWQKMGVGNYWLDRTRGALAGLA